MKKSDLLWFFVLSDTILYLFLYKKRYFLLIFNQK
nr:MAG TPA: protein of unknown function (DUF5542) [Caudoviricetes sp.]